jgi:hypothetical protein
MLPEHVAVIVARFPEPAVLRLSKWKMLAFFSPVFLLWTAAAWRLWPIVPYFQLLQWVVVGGLLGGAVLFLILYIAISFAKDLPRLTLHSEGFLHTTLLASSRLRWENVVGFKPIFGGVGFKRAQGHNLWARINSYYFLVGLYQIDSKDISLLMTAWRARALASSPQSQ